MHFHEKKISFYQIFAVDMSCLQSASMNTFKVRARPLTSKKTYGRIEATLGVSRVFIQGVWPCDPRLLYCDMELSGKLELMRYKKDKKQVYRLLSEVQAENREWIVTMSLLSVVADGGILRKFVQRHESNAASVLEEAYVQVANKGAIEDSSRAKDEDFHSLREIVQIDEDIDALLEFTSAYENVRNKVNIMMKYPKIPASACINIPFNSLAAFEEDPYMLCRMNSQKREDMLVVSDSIAQELKFSADDKNRTQAYLVSAYRKCQQRQGHIWFRSEYMFQQLISDMKASEWGLPVRVEDMREIVKELHVTSPDGLSSALKSDADMETRIATALKEMKENMKPMHRELCEIDEKFNVLQREAVEMVRNNRVSILTGKAGTGKTTVLRAIVDMCVSDGCSVLCAAPTGKAAARMSECTGQVAHTMHHLLTSPTTSGFSGVFILDEASMASIWVIDKLLTMLGQSVFRVVFVGDSNQLPSVDAGAFFRDVIESKKLAHVQLETILRQGTGSTIVKKADSVLRGTAASIVDDEHFSDWNISFTTNPTARAIDEVRQLHEKGLESQLLLQTNKHRAYANKQIQSFVNTNPVLLEKMNILWKLGDKVVNTENKYEMVRGVRKLVLTNGDMGFVVDVDADNDTIRVQFPSHGTEHTFDVPTSKIEHAYAVTVHKYQGCEHANVVFVLDLYSAFQSKQSVYTGITRASETCSVYCSKKDWVAACCQNVERRMTRLAEEIVRMMNKRDSQQAMLLS